MVTDPRTMVLGAVLLALPLRFEPHAATQTRAAASAPVTINFRALAEDGQPVLDLKPADVELKIDGRTREVRSLELVRTAGRTPATPAPALPAPFATNVLLAGGRDVLLLFDEESITPGREQPLRAAAGSMIDALSSGDRVSLISTRQGGPNVGLTTDFAGARKVLASIEPHAAGRETVESLMCRTLRLIGTLESVFGTVAGRRPSTIVFFSASAAAMEPGQTAKLGAATGSGPCQLRLDHFKQLGGAAQAAQPHFYVVEIVDVGGAQLLPEAAGGLENLAGAAGGDLIRLTGAGDAQMARIARETAAYYAAGFEPEASERGSRRRVELRVARPGVTVRARDVTIPKPGRTRARTSPRDMIRTGTPFSDLPLRATAFSSRNTGAQEIKVVTIFEAADPSAKLAAAMVGMYDEKGRLTAQWTAQSADLAQRTVMGALAVAPGKYRLRVAAVDEQGRSGAVDAEVAAALVNAGPIGLSDLAFGLSGQNGMTPVLQFGNQETGLAFLELYGRPAGPLSARVEIASTPEGPALTAVPVQAAASSEADRFMLTATLPLGSLEPGDYLVRAVIGVQGQPEGRVVRTLRKVRSGS